MTWRRSTRPWPTEVAEGWQQVLARTAFIGGPQVAAFEAEYAAFIGARHCVGVANGTDAIEIALRALGIGPGDECILPANTFIATAEAVSRAGATPVLVDCADDGTYLIDTAAVEAAVTAAHPGDHPGAPVRPGRAGRAAAAARRRGSARWVVEDAAQSQGARRNGTGAGALAHAAATSFYPGKNLGAYGDAGAVLTGSGRAGRADAGAQRTTARARKYEHQVLGFNSRLDTLQAVVLSAKLRRLAGWNEARRAAAQRYDELLAGLRRSGAAADPGRQ